MTVQKVFVKNRYDGNGSKKNWPITFDWDKNHQECIKVYTRVNGVLSQTTNFTIQINEDTGNYEVFYPAAGNALASGDKIIIARELPLQQVLNLVNQGPFFADDIEITFDEVVMMCQQLNERLGRSLKVGIDIDSDSDIDVTIPVPTDENNYGLRMTKDGFQLVNDPSEVYDDCVRESSKAEVAKTAAESAKNRTEYLVNGHFPYVTPQMFNAKGDGVTDDTKALQQAIDYAVSKKAKLVINDGVFLTNTLRVRGDVHIDGNGTLKAYPIRYANVVVGCEAREKDIVVDDVSKFSVGQMCAFLTNTFTQIMYVQHIEGNKVTFNNDRVHSNTAEEIQTGFRGRIDAGIIIHIYPQTIVVNKYDYPSMVEPDATGNEITDVEIKNIKFLGNRTGFIQNNFSVVDGVYCGAIYLYRADNVKIHNIEFKNFNSTALFNYGRVSNYDIDGCRFSNIYSPLDSSYTPYVKDAGYAISSHWDMRYDNHDNIPRNINVTNCVFNNCWGAIFSSAVNKAIYANNIISNCTSRCIVVYGGDTGLDTFDITVDNNKIYDMQGDDTTDLEVIGIHVTVSHKGLVTVSNNTVVTSDGSCLSLEYADNLIVTRNYLEHKNSGYVIHAKDRISNAIFEGNIFKQTCDNETTNGKVAILLKNDSGGDGYVTFKNNLYANSIRINISEFVETHNYYEVIFANELVQCPWYLIRNTGNDKPTSLIINNCQCSSRCIAIMPTMVERNADNVTMVGCNNKDKVYLETSPKYTYKSTTEREAADTAFAGTVIFDKDQQELYVRNASSEWVSCNAISEQGIGYIRYANGLQICYLRNNGGNTVEYPKSFVDKPTVIATTEGTDALYSTQVDGTVTNATSMRVYVKDASGNNRGFTYNAIAIGRWK